MGKENKKEDLMDATMRIVAEGGLSNFSMKKVTDKVGVSEALIYRHFATKENLLYLCYEQVHKEIAALFDGTLPDLDSEKEIYSILNELWMRYFRFLVDGRYRTLFYFEYRDSSYVRVIREKDREARNSYFAGFVRLFSYFDSRYRVLEKTDSDHLWTYILDTTGVFAKRVIRGELPDSAESCENIWKLISTGIMGLLA